MKPIKGIANRQRTQCIPPRSFRKCKNE